MLKVLIVDDEALVRAGICYRIPWKDFDMEVTAEAGSVAEAVEILQKDLTIDIVFTDIMMSGQDGLVLLRWIRENRPNITPVVLSYHSDFTYVQEALRLGTVDYIVKTELGDPNFLRSMENIAARARQGNQNLKNIRREASGVVYAGAVAICGMGNADFAVRQEELLEADGHYPISEDSWILLYEEPLTQEQLLELDRIYSQKGVLLTVNQVDVSIPDLILSVNMFFARDFFYKRLPHFSVYSLNPHEILTFSASLSGPEYVQLEQEFSSMQWVWDPKRMDMLMTKISDNRLMPSSVYNLFYSLQAQWSRFFPQNDIPTMFPLTGIHYWYQWQDWVANFRTFTTTQSQLSAYSPEVVRGVQGLLPWIDNNFMQDITLTMAAQRTNLSSSYLSRCFKEIVGVTFSQYVRDTRIDYAQKMLEQSNLPIRRISELCGFQDYFYFDKVFKKVVGLTPGVFRQKNGREKK